MAPAAPPQEPSALPTTTAADAAAVPVPQSAVPRVPQPAKASSGELDGRRAPGGAFTKKWTARLFGKAEPEAHPTETETAAAAEAAAAAAAADSSAPRQLEVTLEVTFTAPGEEGGGEGGEEGGGEGGGEEGGEEGLAGGVPRLFLGLHLSSTNAILAMEPGGLAAQVRLRATA